MADTTPKYAANDAVTITLASLASSSTWLAGREGNEEDNTSVKYDDVEVSGKITVGTTPTINTLINIYVYGSDVSLATTPIDVLDGVDSAETLTNTGILYSAIKLGVSIPVPATTSDVPYAFAPFSIASLFGGNMPKFWGIFVSHNTGVNLNATGGNHVIAFHGINKTIA